MRAELHHAGDEQTARVLVAWSFCAAIADELAEALGTLEPGADDEAKPDVTGGPP
jgi:hypothetical protein